MRAQISLPLIYRGPVWDLSHIYEAQSWGADAVVLCSDLLKEPDLLQYSRVASSLGMEVIVEIHDKELLTAPFLRNAEIVLFTSNSVHNSLDIEDCISALQMRTMQNSVFILDNFITTIRDVARIRTWGGDALLIRDEMLRRTPSPSALLRTYMTAPGGTTASLFARTQPPFIKICGLTDPIQVTQTSLLNAGAFGLMLAPSRRQISLEQARSIIKAVKKEYVAPSPLAVGVFINEPPDRIAEIASDLGLHALQLSGDEQPEICAALHAQTSLPILKTIRIGEDRDQSSLDAYLLVNATLILDALVAGNYGGTGQVGNWETAQAIAQSWPIILAGGLNLINVRDALTKVVPRGLDVSSGVEINGVKSVIKMQTFIKVACERSWPYH